MESGVFALVLGLVLLLVPVVLVSPFRPLVAGMMMGNLFYQAHADPFFWLVLALAWLTLSASSAAGGAQQNRTRSPHASVPEPLSTP